MPRDIVEQVGRLIDSERFLEAINILNRHIKKQPNLLILKVFKCEALYGLGNVAESDELMAIIYKHTPLDKGTIDCIASFYQEVGNYSKLVQVYEEALKHCPTNELLRIHLYQSCGLAGDFKKQHKQALILFKQTSRMLYYFSAVVCLLQQANENTMAVELAGRMMMKQYDSVNIRFPSQIFLMITVLERQNKFDDALYYLEKHASELGPIISIMNKKLQYLESLEKWPEIIELVKPNLFFSPDNWLNWRMYLKSVLKLKEMGGCNNANVDDSIERARDFLLAMAERHINSRGPPLAAIELLKLNPPSDFGLEMSLLLEKYFQQFGAKAICVFDLSPYIPLLPTIYREEFLTKISAPNFRNVPGIKLQTQMGTSKHITFLQISRIAGENAFLSVWVRDLLCLDLEMCFVAAGNCDRRDHYLQFLTEERFYIYNETRDIDHLIKAARLLENALIENPVFSLKLLLIRTYFTLGATTTARKMYEQLNIENAQVDTLIYLFLTTLSSTGHFSLACEMWNSALKTLKKCAGGSSEALLTCYSEGIFYRVEETTECARRFKFTISEPFLKCEKNFLDIVMSEPSKAHHLILRSNSSIKWDSCLDNRDVSALPNWEPPSCRKTIAESFSELLLLGKIREATICCLSTAIALGKQRGEHEKKNFLSSLQKLKTFCADATNLPYKNNTETRIIQIAQTPLATILEILLEPDLSHPNTLCTLLTNGVDGCVDFVKKSHTRNPRSAMEAVVTEIELLSVVTVVCGTTRAGLSLMPRRRCDQVVHSLNSAWETLKVCLSIIKTYFRLSPDSNSVERKLREDIQAASEELRKVIRKKITYLNKLISNK